MSADRPMNTGLRVFQLFTLEGSFFVMKFEPEKELHGTWFGRVELVGEAATQGNRKIRVKGIGAMPEVSSRIVVSDQPLETQLVQGEPVPIYPQETITRVIELPPPSLA